MAKTASMSYPREMKRFLNLFVALLFPMAALLATPAGAAETKATGDFVLQYGKIYPQGHLASFLGEGESYRAKIFGGVKINSKWLGAVGLGMDFTYSDIEPKDTGSDSHFRRYQWDLFILPLSVWLFTLESGFMWNVTDTKLSALGIEETSIRPGFVTNLGFRLPVAPHVIVRADGRYEYVFKDTERTLAGEKLNISGSFYSVLGGLEFYF
jgi:hypothetical protein